MKSRDQPGLV